MMEDLSAHIMDIVANSISARAKKIDVVINEDSQRSLLTISVADDGIGMDENTKKMVIDPFFSTKTGRKVGLGIPLLKGTAETTGGSFILESSPGKGTQITVTFDSAHPDLPPLGNFKELILILVVGNPDIDFVFRCKKNDLEFCLDTCEIKSYLDGVPLNHPDVIDFLSKYLDEHFRFI